MEFGTRCKEPVGRIYNGIVLFEENSILLLPECSEASGVEFSWGEVSQESPKNHEKSVKISVGRAYEIGTVPPPLAA